MSDYIHMYAKGEALHKKLHRLALEVGKNPLTIGDGLDRLTARDNVYGIRLLLLSLPGALPMPTFGIKPMVGVVVLLIGLQMFIGKHSVWLPHWFTCTRLRPDWSMQAAHLGERHLPRLEDFVKHRMNWMKYRLGIMLLGIAVICLGLIFILSIIPGAKILAGLGLLSLSLGLIKSDGLLTLLSALVALILVALHAEVVYLFVTWLKG